MSRGFVGLAALALIFSICAEPGCIDVPIRLLWCLTLGCIAGVQAGGFLAVWQEQRRG